MKKQETFNEAAERLFKEYSNNISLAEGHYDYMMDKDDFKEASLEMAKWQQEKYEKDLNAHLDIAEHLWLQAVKENKKMYSEEEVVYALLLCSNKKFKNSLEVKEWFEKFKKKQT